MMAVTKVPEKLNEVVTEAIASLMEPLSNPIIHGEFNRRMFLEAVVVKGGVGAAIDKEDIVRYCGITDKEFNTIKDEYITKGIIKETKTQFDTVLYSLCL
jgi:hypothetical protein